MKKIVTSSFSLGFENGKYFERDITNMVNYEEDKPKVYLFKEAREFKKRDLVMSMKDVIELVKFKNLKGGLHE